MRKNLLMKIAPALVACLPLAMYAQESINVNALKVENKISPYLYGANIEDVNHSIYGGLYDQRIFGESFEEPVTGSPLKDFDFFEGDWSVSEDGVVSVARHGGAKMINNSVSLGDSYVEVELKFNTEGGENAGLVIHVTKAGNGADAFRGYEVSISRDGKQLILGRHDNNYRELAKGELSINPDEWNKLAVKTVGATLEILVNGTSIITCTDDDPIMSGYAGLRTWHSDASFRNMKVTDENSIVDFEAYGGNWTVADGVLSVARHGGAKLVHKETLGDSSVEMEMKFTTDGGDSAGFAIHVTDPKEGADNFNGYEVGISRDGKKLIFGKHEYNWQSISETPIDIVPTEWNKLKVKTVGKKFEIYVNDELTTSYEDPTALLEGGVGFRTWNADVSFRNLKIERDGDVKDITLRAESKQSDLKLMQNPAYFKISSMWDAIVSKDAVVNFAHITDDAYNTNCSQEVDFVSGTGVAGVANRSLNKWGIAVKQNQTFKGFLFLKGEVSGKVYVALQNVDGTKEYAVQEIDGITSDWKKYTFELTSNTEDVNSRLAVYIKEPGQFRIDMVNMMSSEEDQFHGAPFRKDIAEAMVEQKLTFLRYAGTMIECDGYRFKSMIGPREDRPVYNGRFYGYASHGFGIEDFLNYCELSGFEPVFAVNSFETAEDMAFMIKYLKGDISTPEGKMRADNGHPEPYHLTYIEIGNEEVLGGDNADQYMDYVRRFTDIYQAIHSIDPTIKFISSAWWRPESEDNMRDVFECLDGMADYWDYHPWADSDELGGHVEREMKQMQEMFLKWNPNTTMKCALFEENGNSHNIRRALGHVTIQNAARRMGDFVLATCAANALQPYKQNDNGWDQGTVFFTPSQVWGMPTYYAQKMASENHKPLLVQSEAPASLDVVAATDENCDQVVLYVVNKNAEAVEANVNVAGKNDTKQVRTITLSGQLNDVNTPSEPERIVPVAETLDGVDNINYSFKPYSYTIMIFDNKSVGISDVTEDSYLVVSADKQIVIRSAGNENTPYEVFSLAGASIAKGQVAASGEASVNCQAGAYLVALRTVDGTKVYKVIVR